MRVTAIRNLIADARPKGSQCPARRGRGLWVRAAVCLGFLASLCREAPAPELQVRSNSRLIVNSGGHVIINGDFLFGSDNLTPPTAGSGGTLEMNGTGKLSIAGDANLVYGGLNTGAGAAPGAGAGAFTAGTVILAGNFNATTDVRIRTHANQDLFNLTIGSDGGTYPTGWAADGTKIADNALDINGDVRITGGTFDPGSFTHTVAGNWTKTGGAFAPTAGTITFDGAGTQTLYGTGIRLTFFNLTVDKDTGSVVLSDTMTASGAWTINDTAGGSNAAVVYAGNWTGASNRLSAGSLTVGGTGAATLDLSRSGQDEACELDVSGSVTLNAGGRILIDHAGDMLRVGGSWNDVNANGGFVPTLGSVEFYNGAGTLSQRTAATANNFYDVTFNGTALKTASTALDFNGNVTISTTVPTFDGATFTHTIAGNWTNNGSSSSFTGSTSTIKFDGTAAQTIGGTASTTFNAVTVNNTSSAGVTVNTSQTANGATAVDRGTVTLAAGKTYTANDTVTVGKATVTAGTPELGTLKIASTGGGVATLSVANGKTLEVKPNGTLQITGVSGGNQGTIAAVSGSYAFILKGTLDASNFSVSGLDTEGLQIRKGANIAGLSNGTLTNPASLYGPLLNFSSPVGSEADWPDGADRDKLPNIISGITFTGEITGTPENDYPTLTGDANVKSSYKTPAIHFTGYAGNLTSSGTQAGGERYELDYADRITWDEYNSASDGVAQIVGGNYYSTLQAAVNAAANNDVINANTREPLGENIVVSGKNLVLNGFVLAPKSGLAVQVTSANVVTLRNTVVAAGGIQGYDSGANKIVCQNCTIFGFGSTFDDDFVGSTKDAGVWAETTSGGTATVGTETVGSEVISRIQITQTSGNALVETVKNPFPTSGTFYLEVRFRYDSLVGAPSGSGIRVCSGGKIGSGAEEVLKIWQEAGPGNSLRVANTNVYDFADDASIHKVKLYWDGATYYWWFDDTVASGSVASGVRPNYIALGNVDADLEPLSGFDVDYIRVTGVPEVTNASLTNTIQEIGDNGTSAISDTTNRVLQLTRKNATVDKQVFVSPALYDFHILKKPASAPTWPWPIDQGKDMSGTYTADFQGQTRPYDGDTAVNYNNNWDIGADEYRQNAGVDVTPSFVYPGTSGEPWAGSIKSFTFLGGRRGTAGAGSSDGNIYAYFVTAGGGADPSQDNTLRLFQIGAWGSPTNVEITTASNRLKAPGTVLMLTYIHNGSEDIRVYCVVDRDQDGRGDAIWAVQDTGVNSGTIFKEAISGASFDFTSRTSTDPATTAGWNNWGTSGTGDDFDNTPSGTQGVRDYGPGRILNLVGVQIPGATTGSPRRLWFAVEKDDHPTLSAYTKVLYCVDADTGTTLWVQNGTTWDYRPFPSIFPSPIVTGGVTFSGLAPGEASGYDVCKMAGIMDTASPFTMPTLTAVRALPAANGDNPNGTALDVGVNYAGDASTFYFATGTTSRIYKTDASLNMTGWSNDGPVTGVSVRLDTATSESTNTPVQIVWASNYYYVGAGKKLYRLGATDGRKQSGDAVGTSGYVDSNDWPLTMNGPLSTYIFNDSSLTMGGTVLYFGTAAGGCYAMQANDSGDGVNGLDGAGGIMSGWPYLVPGQRIVGITSLNGIVYFATDQGQIYGFPQQ